MSKYILKANYGMDKNHIGYVEMTQGISMNVYLTEDPYKATYRSLDEAKRWAKDILKNGDGTSTWKIEIVPLEATQ